MALPEIFMIHNNWGEALSQLMQIVCLSVKAINCVILGLVFPIDLIIWCFFFFSGNTGQYIFVYIAFISSASYFFLFY